MKKRSTKATGDLGEEIAVTELRRKGMRILERNWRCQVGEIDIIGEDGDELVLVEVKTKIGESFGSPEEMISEKKLDRIRSVSWCYDTEVDRKRRIDIVAIVLKQNGAILRLEHYIGMG